MTFAYDIYHSGVVLHQIPTMPLARSPKPPLTLTQHSPIELGISPRMNYQGHACIKVRLVRYPTFHLCDRARKADFKCATLGSVRGQAMMGVRDRIVGAFLEGG